MLMVGRETLGALDETSDSLTPLEDSRNRCIIVDRTRRVGDPSMTRLNRARWNGLVSLLAIVVSLCLALDLPASPAGGGPAERPRSCCAKRSTACCCGGPTKCGRTRPPVARHPFTLDRVAGGQANCPCRVESPVAPIRDTKTTAVRGAFDQNTNLVSSPRHFDPGAGAAFVARQRLDCPGRPPELRTVRLLI